MVEKQEPEQKAEKPDAKSQVEAAKGAVKSPTIPMQAPEGASSVSVDGKEIKVPKTGRIEVAIEHVEALIAHGFEVIVKELEKL